MRTLTLEEKAWVLMLADDEWSGNIAVDDVEPRDVESVDVAWHTRPEPHEDGRDTLFYWLVHVAGRFVGINPKEMDDRVRLHSMTGAPRVIDYTEMRALGLRPPHCDSRVVHAPGECEVCDEHAGHLQREREANDVCFTGKKDRRWPCPADVARPETNQRWHGNRPWKSEAQ